jgi:hypothetical protein
LITPWYQSRKSSSLCDPSNSVPWPFAKALAIQWPSHMVGLIKTCNDDTLKHVDFGSGLYRFSMERAIVEGSSSWLNPLNPPTPLMH